MKKKSKISLEEIIIEEPSKAFCERCQNSDIRRVKDTLNLAASTILEAAELLGIDGNFERKCKEIRKWIKKTFNGKKTR